MHFFVVVIIVIIVIIFHSYVPIGCWGGMPGIKSRDLRREAAKSGGAARWDRDGGDAANAGQCSAKVCLDAKSSLEPVTYLWSCLSLCLDSLSGLFTTGGRSCEETVVRSSEAFSSQTKARTSWGSRGWGRRLRGGWKFSLTSSWIQHLSVLR
jgi:hypothetical protein